MRLRVFIIRGFIVTDRGLLSIAAFLRLSLSVLLPPVYVSAELTVGQTAAVDDIE